MKEVSVRGEGTQRDYVRSRYLQEQVLSPPTFRAVDPPRTPPPNRSLPSPAADSPPPLPPPPGSTKQGVSNEPSASKLRAGLAAGIVVGAVVLVAALVVFLVMRWRHRRQGEEADVDPLHQISSPSLLESQIFTSNKNGEEGGNGSTTPREALKLSPSLELLQLPESQPQSKTHSTTSTTTSSLSTGDQAQTQLVSVGIKAFSYQELSQATNDFSQDNFLGQGGFGSVYRGGGVLASGGLVAIKQLQSGSFQGEREFLTEINVISRVHHMNLVSLVGYCISGPERLLVYEYVANNNLAFHLQGTSTPVLDWPTRLSIALGAAKGIAYLHEECHPRIIHRDIKSTNILLDSNFRAKVADFGLAKFVPDDKTHVTTRIIGTFGYLAPEFGSSGRLTEKSDVFSFGVVLLELITGRQPINLTEWASILLDQALEDGKFEVELIDAKLADNYDREEMNRMVTCAASCVNRFPDLRPRMSKVVQVLDGSISPEQLKAETSRLRVRRPA